MGKEWEDRLLALMFVIVLLAVGAALGSYIGYEAARAECPAPRTEINLPLLPEVANPQSPQSGL